MVRILRVGCTRSHCSKLHILTLALRRMGEQSSSKLVELGTDIECRRGPDRKRDEKGGFGYVAIAGNPTSNFEKCAGDRAIDVCQRDGEIDPYPN